jgi:hypothetical protein
VDFPFACAGEVEIDHVRASGGIGLKSRSTPDNLASLCWVHHRYKTDHTRVARPLLLDYLERVEGGISAYRWVSARRSIDGQSS